MHVIRAKQVFDGERFIGEADVVLDGGTVVDVGTPQAYAADVGIEDLGDVTVLPGLVDAHQHLTWDCSPEPATWHSDNDDDALLERGRVSARLALASGVTTVRDLGGRGRTTLALRDECAHDPSAGPALLVAGPALTSPGGHCWYLGAECADAAALRARVADLARWGVDVVKVMATGGNVTPGSQPHESQFGVAELRAVVDAAHAEGLPVAAHAHGTAGVTDAIAAGVDTIEHASFMSADGVARDPELVARLAASRIWVSVTGGNLPGTLPPPIQIRLPALHAHVKDLLDAGTRCILSTDAGIGPLKPPDVLARSVIQAVDEVGATVEHALAMCTSRAAEAIGVGDRAGRLRRGLRADAVVLEGRVDRDTGALLRPLRVLRGGVVVASTGAPDAVSALDSDM
jgi:imidazolonepropionase-like amidohydrolase